MASLCKGAYLVTYRHSNGGGLIVDMSMIIAGRGIISDPWIVKSLINHEIYQVNHKDIDGESYHHNYSFDDAKIIYKFITNRNQSNKNVDQ